MDETFTLHFRGDKITSVLPSVGGRILMAGLVTIYIPLLFSYRSLEHTDTYFLLTICLCNMQYRRPGH